MEKIINFTEKHTKIIVPAIFLIGVILYTVLAKGMTVPVYKGVDEELYIGMARSFFFDRKLCKKLSSIKLQLYNIFYGFICLLSIL